jgi:hypothetical protein
MYGFSNSDDVRASLSPLLRMLSLLIGPLLVRSAFWRRPLAADTCRPVMTYKANTGQTREFLKMPAPDARPLRWSSSHDAPSPLHRGNVPGDRCGFSELSRSAPCVSCETASGNSVRVPTVCLNVGRQEQHPGSTKYQNNAGSNSCRGKSVI